MRPVSRRGLLPLLPLLAFGLTTGHALAADGDYPNHNVRVVVWSGPGSTIDLFARLLSEAMAKKWGQAVTVDNRLGAGGIVASQYVATQPADGYTILITTTTAQLHNALLKLKIPYDPVKSFDPVSLLVEGQYAFVAAQTAPYNNLKEFLAYAKTKPGGLSYGSWGQGSAAHLFGDYLGKLSGTQLVHVPYKTGEIGTMTDMIGGSLDAAFWAQGSARTYSQSGKIKILAITGNQRNKALPDVPTFAEQGFKNFDLPGWIGAYVPAGTPAAVTAKIARTMQEVMKQPEIGQRMADAGFDIVGSTPSEFSARYGEEYRKWRDLIKVVGIQPE
jgi:tripartite-type tricarboxylate transporter receptor subunit TctC